jgi:hypothetical protein
MSSYLIDDRPITFLPMLAKALGSCERAIVLQQIHWLSRLPNSGLWDDDGLHWVWGTYEEWCNDYFTMWEPPSLKRHILNLEKMGVLISAQLRAHLHDQTKFYRINYAHELLNRGMGQHVIPSNVQEVIASSAQDISPSSYNTKTSTENTQKKEDRPPQGRNKKATNRRDEDGTRKSYQPEDYGF